VTDPVAAEALFERGVQLLNENIREIRGYINSLSASGALTRHEFSNALAVLIENAKGGRSTEFIVRIDEAAEARLSPSQIPDILQIVREAISNALRHGAASQITIRLHEDGDRLALLVADNGTGFNTATVSRGGNGIANFRARAVLLNAELRLDSQPGDGSRLVITFPTLPLA
jgi:signal transduction histidine kinase